MTRSRIFPPTPAPTARNARSRREDARATVRSLALSLLGEPSEFLSVKDPAKSKSKRGSPSQDQLAAPSMCTSLIRAFPAPDSRFSTPRLASLLLEAKRREHLPLQQKLAFLSSTLRLPKSEVYQLSRWVQQADLRGQVSDEPFKGAATLHEVLFAKSATYLALHAGSSRGTPPSPSSSRRGTKASSSSTSRASAASSEANSKRRRSSSRRRR